MFLFFYGWIPCVKIIRLLYAHVLVILLAFFYDFCDCAYTITFYVMYYIILMVKNIFLCTCTLYIIYSKSWINEHCEHGCLLLKIPVFIYDPPGPGRIGGHNTHVLCLSVHLKIKNSQKTNMWKRYMGLGGSWNSYNLLSIWSYKRYIFDYHYLNIY